jgi:hypothetical protein
VQNRGEAIARGRQLQLSDVTRHSAGSPCRSRHTLR